MANEITNSPAPATQPNAPLRLSTPEVVNELSACLALVRPVSMSDDMAGEWLAVAAREVLNLDPRAFRAGCAEARRNCSHHGQIIPTVTNGKEAKWYKSIGALYAPPPRETVLAISADKRVQGLIADAAKGCSPQ